MADENTKPTCSKDYGDGAWPMLIRLPASPRSSHASLNMQAAIGIEHQFGKIAIPSVTYINYRGVHQYSD
jgi:hypothetical protein